MDEVIKIQVSQFSKLFWSLIPIGNFSLFSEVLDCVERLTESCSGNCFQLEDVAAGVGIPNAVYLLCFLVNVAERHLYSFLWKDKSSESGEA